MPRGAWPLPLPEHYAWDAEHLAEYARLAATERGLRQYLDQHVYERQRGLKDAYSPRHELSLTSPRLRGEVDRRSAVG